MKKETREISEIWVYLNDIHDNNGYMHLIDDPKNAEQRGTNHVETDDHWTHFILPEPMTVNVYSHYYGGSELDNVVFYENRKLQEVLIKNKDHFVFRTNCVYIYENDIDDNEDYNHVLQLGDNIPGYGYTKYELEELVPVYNVQRNACTGLLVFELSDNEHIKKLLKGIINNKKS